MGLPLLYDEQKECGADPWFKEYCAYLFFKGSLLLDPEGILIQQTENVQASRQIRFTSAAQIRKNEKGTFSLYLRGDGSRESRTEGGIEKTKAYPVPDEFRSILTKDKN